MQSMWAGTLSFGLAEIPVRLGPATRPRELAFRQVHAADGGRITVRRCCTDCGAEVSYADVAKAYQRPDGTLVPLTDEDLASLPLEASHRIDVLFYTSPTAIDPLLVSHSYFLTPDPGAPVAAPSALDPTVPSLSTPTTGAPTTGAPGPSAHGTAMPAAHAYALFRDALARSGRVAVATITLRQRQARATLWPRGQALVLQTLLTPPEITTLTPDELPGPAATAAPSDAEPTVVPHSAEPPAAPGDAALAVLTEHIAAMTRDFDPAGHHDAYRDQLEALIRTK